MWNRLRHPFGMLAALLGGMILALAGVEFALRLVYELRVPCKGDSEVFIAVGRGIARG